MVEFLTGLALVVVMLLAIPIVVTRFLPFFDWIASMVDRYFEWCHKHFGRKW